MKQKIGKKKVISAKQLEQMIDSYKKLLPQWLVSPAEFINVLLFYFNSLMIFVCYFLVIGQSILVLSSDKKHQNLKYVLLKWIIISVNAYLSESLRIQGNNNEFMILIVNLVSFFFIYPFQFSRKLIVKYSLDDKQKDKLNESKSQLEQQIRSKIPLIYRLTIWMIVLALTICKYVLTFIHPSYRKQIQVKIKEINVILVQQKYFWKFYDVNSSSVKLQKPSSLRDSQDQYKKKEAETPKISNMKKQGSQQSIPQTQYIRKPTRQNKQPPPLLKYSTQMYIQVLGGLSKGVDSAKRRYTYYCQMQFEYNQETTELKVIIPGQDKPHSYILKQVQAIQNDLIKFSFQPDDAQQSEIIVKFNSKQDKESFLQKINSYEC